MGSQKIIMEWNERFIIHIRTTNRKEILNGGADERSVAGENQTGTAGRYFSTVFTAAGTLYFLFKYLIKVTMDPLLAEDLVQDTMVRCMEKINTYNGTSSFSSWLITIATRIFIDRKRRWKREAEWKQREQQEQGIRSIRWRFESRGKSGVKCWIPSPNYLLRKEWLCY